jgi:hypothetical protein
MKKALLPAIAAAALLVACVPSVNPFYTDKDVVTDPRLAGAWVETGKKERAVLWTFAAPTNNAYAVALKDDDGKTGKFEGHLFKLGKETFLDLTPTECKFDDKQAGLVGCAVVPGHLLVRVKLEDAKLSLAFCNPDWTQKFLEKNPDAVAHRVADGGVFLTADTAALQKFVLAHLGKGELFGDFGDYQRVAQTPAK